MSLGLAAHLPYEGAMERSAAHLLYLQLDLLGYPAKTVEAHWMQLLLFSI